jgi:hypothetical protein
MGTAGRIRKSSGSRTFYCLDAVSRAVEVEAFEKAFYSGIDVDAAFWGDLDHAGMAILSSLRTSFPSARAWEPGYAPMLGRLEAGDGHAPEEARKAGQNPISSTGCSYADGVLIPALVKHGRFIDQEYHLRPTETLPGPKPALESPSTVKRTTKENEILP